MGIIDTTHYRVTCAKCTAQDHPKALQYGSAYSAGHWSSPTSDLFKLQFSVTNEGEDVIVSATCNSCGNQAEVVTTKTGP